MEAIFLLGLTFCRFRRRQIASAICVYPLLLTSYASNAELCRDNTASMPHSAHRPVNPRAVVTTGIDAARARGRERKRREGSPADFASFHCIRLEDDTGTRTTHAASRNTRAGVEVGVGHGTQNRDASARRRF
jgi:hypothetical protein